MTGKQKILEETLKSIEYEAVRYKEEVTILRSTLRDVDNELKTKRSDYEKLFLMYEDKKKSCEKYEQVIKSLNESQRGLENVLENVTNENKYIRDRNEMAEQKITEFNKEIKQGFNINKKLEIQNDELHHRIEKLFKENELLKKNKLQKEKYIQILLKEKNKKIENDAKLKLEDLNNQEYNQYAFSSSIN